MIYPYINSGNFINGNFLLSVRVLVNTSCCSTLIWIAFSKLVTHKGLKKMNWRS